MSGRVDTVRAHRSSESGFALPSVLFLITILGIVASSILSLHYLRHKEALRDVARVKAEYASQSGLSTSLADIRNGTVEDGTLWAKKHEYRFDDGRSSARVKVEPWGMFYLVRSEGVAQGVTRTRNALVGEEPDSSLSGALLFAHRSHQLVLTGNVRIRGEITTGSSGVTIGTLRDHSTPLLLPVEGSHRKVEGLALPEVQSPPLVEELDRFNQAFRDSLGLGSNVPHRPIFHSAGEITLVPEMIPDSVTALMLDGDVVIGDTFDVRDQELQIIVGGSLSIGPRASIRGLIRFYTFSEVTISRTAVLENVVIVSRSGIIVEERGDFSAQLFAPIITVGAGARLRYPSIVYSVHTIPKDTLVLGLTLGSGALVEGFVGLSSSSDGDPKMNVLRIAPGAMVTGVVYSNTRIECDGEITGSVITNDFYFYEEPTMYLGWVRRGMIDRVNLPLWYHAPTGLTREHRLQVLRWL